MWATEPGPTMSDKRNELLEAGQLSPRNSREPTGNHNSPAEKIQTNLDIVPCKLKQRELGPNTV